MTLTLCTFLLLACSDDSSPGSDAGEDAADTGDAVIDTAGVDTTPDTPSPLFILRAETADQLISGPVEQGQAGGAWVLGNDRVRFMIQDVGVSVGYNIYGGSLVGGDLVRDHGDSDQSLIREAMPIVDWRILAPEEATIVNDGADGGPVTLRLTGRLQPTRIIDLLDAIAGDSEVDVAVEYEVQPDKDALIIRTVITNETDTDDSVMIGDFLVFGGELKLWTNGQGFGADGAIGAADVIASRSDRVSYGYSRAGGGFSVPFINASGTAALLDPGLKIPAGETVITERELWVGDGQLSSVLGPLQKLIGDEVVTASGVVTEVGGAPAAGVTVTALASPSESRASNQAITDDQGRFTMTLKAGDYAFIASDVERRPSDPKVETLGDDGKDDIALELAPAAMVTLNVTGDGPTTEDNSFPVRVSLRPLQSDVLDERLGDFPRYAGAWKVVYAGAGLESFPVSPGNYDIVLSRGPEYERVVLDNVALDDGSVIAGHLTQSNPTPGFVSCDFHQHTIGSLDSETPVMVKLRQNLSAGLECAALTEHDNLTDIRPFVEEIGARPTFLGIVGDEVSVNGVGHFNAFPLPIDKRFELTGVKLYLDLSVNELFAKLRSIEGERTIQINHPRDDGLAGYFLNIGLDPATLEATKEDLPVDFDALEVTSIGTSANFTLEGWQSLSNAAGGDVPVLADYFGLINGGLKITAIGNSDCHDPNANCAYPRNYLRAGDDIATINEDDITAAIAAQHNIVSRGLWLHPTTNGEFKMGRADLVDGSTTPPSFGVTVSAPSWLTVSVVELYVNGVFVESRPATAPAEGQVMWFDETFMPTLVEDSTVVFVTRGGGDTSPVFGGSPFAFSNPIYIDVDGDGEWTAPGAPPAPAAP